jgi:ATP-dependent Clp protease protease subunit
LPHATVHMHQPLGGAEGQASDIEIQAREIIRLKSRLMGILSESTGQTIEVIERDTDRNFYMDAQQAVDYGLVDQVLAPPKSS